MSEQLQWVVGIATALAGWAFMREREEIRRRLEVTEKQIADLSKGMQTMAVAQATAVANHIAVETRIGDLTDAIAKNTDSVAELARELGGVMAELKILMEKRS